MLKLKTFLIELTELKYIPNLTILVEYSNP